MVLALHAWSIASLSTITLIVPRKTSSCQKGIKNPGRCIHIGTMLIIWVLSWSLVPTYEGKNLDVQRTKDCWIGFFPCPLRCSVLPKTKSFGSVELFRISSNFHLAIACFLKESKSGLGPKNFQLNHKLLPLKPKIPTPLGFEAYLSEVVIQKLDHIHPQSWSWIL